MAMLYEVKVFQIQDNIVDVVEQLGGRRAQEWQYHISEKKWFKLTEMLGYVDVPTGSVNQSVQQALAAALSTPH
jgi:hypothetical protein